MSVAPRSSSSFMLSRWPTVAVAVAIVCAGLLAYHNSFSGVLILDDKESIIENRSIRQLWPLSQVLTPPQKAGVSGRPLANVTLALNYAVSGLNVWSYHVLNLALHLAAGCTLFGIMRRTCLQPGLRERFGAAARPLALAIATLWTVHPLQTQAVNYLSQRTEVLMGLCYLLALYGFIRGATANPQRWWPLTIAASACGMASKEVMATLPLMILLYDRTFVAGTFFEAGRLRWRFYLALAATWLVLVPSIVNLRQHGVGYGFGVSSFDYALTECRVVVLYLRLAFWPHPLVFDSGWYQVREVVDLAPYALALGSLLVGLLVALRWRPLLGLAGCWFFLILAPSSSVVPVIGQPMAESRMYLSLAAVIVVAVLGLHALVGRRGLAVWFALALVLGGFTVHRNRIYRSEEVLWVDTLAKCPDNARGHNEFGLYLRQTGRLAEAISRFETALRLAPDYSHAYNNLANVLLATDRAVEAIPHFETALRLAPQEASTYNNLAMALLHVGQSPAAIRNFEVALRLDPQLAEAHVGLGDALLKEGLATEGIRHLEAAVRLQPDSPRALHSLGCALLENGRGTEAIVHFQKIARLMPNSAEVLNNLGYALVRNNRGEEALNWLRESLRLRPDFPEAHASLGQAWFQLGRMPEAIEQLEAALQAQPDHTDARYTLAAVLEQCGRRDEAIRHLERVLQAKPDHSEARKLLERLRATLRAADAPLPTLSSVFCSAGFERWVTSVRWRQVGDLATTHRDGDVTAPTTETLYALAVFRPCGDGLAGR